MRVTVDAFDRVRLVTESNPILWPNPVPWFSDADTEPPAPLPYCLLCWALSGVKVRHW